MAGRMTQAQRSEKMAEAVELSARGHTYTQIGETLGVSRQTAKSLINDELALRSEHRGVSEEREKAIAVYSAVIQEAWDRLQATKNTSLNASGFLNTIRSAQDSINKLTGAEAPIQHEEVGQEYVIEWEDEFGA